MSTSSESRTKDILLPVYLKFVFSGMAGIGAVCCTHPMDFLKNRMQISKNRRPRIVYDILKTEGVFTVYSGLSAAVLRQTVYTTSRLGIYTWLLESYTRYQNAVHSPFLVKITLGLIAGGSASLLGTPADVALVRMTLDGRLPDSERRHYRNVFHALYKIIRDENVLALWRGCWPTVSRAMIGNGTQLAVYSQTKSQLMEYGMGDSFGCHLVSSIVSGFATAVTTLPVDIAKTRIQDAKGYKNIRVWIDVVRQEGVFSLWKGFIPYLFRTIPHGVLVFVFLEQFNKFYFKFILKQENVRKIL